jgi:tetratricopeptide (TPR) repeat protein
LSPGGKRWIARGALVGALVALALWVWFWRRPRPPEPPAIDFAQVEPEIAETITAARWEVVQKPYSGPAWGRLGMVFRAHDYSGESSLCFAQAERLDPREPRWPYFQGITLVPIDPDAGIACLERAVERFGDGLLAPRLRLAEALLDNGRLDQADQHLKEVLAREAENPRSHFDMGRLAVMREDWRPALEHLTTCVDDVHARRLALTLRAQVYRRLGEQDHAERDEKELEQLSDDERWSDPLTDEVLTLQRGLSARLMTVDTLTRARRFDQAIPILEDTAKKYPTSPLPWLRLADLWRMVGRMDRAEQACRQAVQADPELAQAWFALGCFQALDRPREAADTFRRAIRLKPDHALAHFNLAYCLGQLGDPAAAATEYRLTLRCSPDYEPARKALKEVEAEIQDRQGKAKNGLAK